MSLEAADAKWSACSTPARPKFMSNGLQKKFAAPLEGGRPEYHLLLIPTMASIAQDAGNCA
jgi:hypothetical protein